MNADGQSVIGVIGGAGVAAGARLAAYVEERVTALGGYRDAHHVELLLWQATSAPSRSMFLEGRGPDFTSAYIRIGECLKACGADVLCMACNAAHSRADNIATAVGLPMIHLLKELFGTVRTRYPEATQAGVLSSTGSRDNHIFDAYANGLHLLYTNDRTQELLTAGICGVKSRNRWLPVTNPERPYTQFLKVSRDLIDKGAQVLVLACADIGVDFPEDEVDGVPVLDSMQVLADSILKYGLKHGDYDRNHPLYEASQQVKGQG
ncbi:MAG: aspartate/glutamate racemase family protein [Kiritimatiellia bacterium]|nr:aspartate/glutamate racemase family protein [Kiritimatiellia bacterium]